MGTWKKNGPDLANNYSPGFDTSAEHLNGSLYNSLANTPKEIAEYAKNHVRPKNLVEKARMNVGLVTNTIIPTKNLDKIKTKVSDRYLTKLFFCFRWLDSSLSIMEQGIREQGVLCLKFKFYVFYDLNPKYDAIRINQIYEQAKWQLLNEEIDCTEEEMLMFAALQLQIDRQASQPQPVIENGNVTSGNEDDIDAALTDLQTTLEGSNIFSQSNDITQVPELYDELRFLK